LRYKTEIQEEKMGSQTGGVKYKYGNVGIFQSHKQMEDRGGSKSFDDNSATPRTARRLSCSFNTIGSKEL